MDKTSLGDRMKAYEKTSRVLLTRRMPLIVRIDGRAFHTYTKRFPKPWSEDIKEGMTRIAKALLMEAMGAKLAYCQSDEVSVLITDYDNLMTDSWFSKNVQKVSSISASIATAAFNLTMFNLAINRRSMNGGLGALVGSDFPPVAHFDARCFVLPRHEVCNYFVWRQQDARRNSISSLAQAHFSHHELQKKSSSQMVAMLKEQHGIDWEACATWKKLGWCVGHKAITVGETPPRTVVSVNDEIPVFSEERDFVEKHVFLEEPEKSA